jgi:hypothetical protein
MEMLAVFYEPDRWVLFVHQLQMEDLISSANSGVEILVLKCELQSQLSRIETDRRLQISSPQLGNYT